MAVLIDASVLIEFERGHLDIQEHVATREDEDWFLSVITASEMLHGVYRAARSEQRATRSAFVEGVLERFPILEIDASIARAHAQLWADLAASGIAVGPHDLWLAATCVAHGLTLVTANAREFGRVPGLRLETWAVVPLDPVAGDAMPGTKV